MKQLETEKGQPAPTWRWQGLVFILLGAAFFLLTLPSMWATSRAITILVALGQVVLIVCAVMVGLRGYRSDRERHQSRARQ